MKTKRTRRSLFGAALALGAAAVFTLGVADPSRAQPGPMPGAMPMAMPTEALANLSGDAFDQAFLREMIMHHAMAVMMSQPVLNAPHRELREQAAAITADQTREVNEMRRWLHEWYGVMIPDPLTMMGPSSSMTPPMPAMASRPDEHAGHNGPMTAGSPLAGPAMPAAGAAPQPDMAMGMMMEMMRMMGLAQLPPARQEATFMSLMIVHHEQAIAMANLALNRAGHEELKALARAIISSQTAEIGHFNHWLAEWYGL